MISCFIHSNRHDSKVSLREAQALLLFLTSQLGTNTTICYVYICSCSKFYGDLSSLIITIRPHTPKNTHKSNRPTPIQSIDSFKIVHSSAVSDLSSSILRRNFLRWSCIFHSPCPNITVSIYHASSSVLIYCPSGNVIKENIINWNQKKEYCILNRTGELYYLNPFNTEVES